jgi:hypothetical protein
MVEKWIDNSGRVITDVKVVSLIERDVENAIEGYDAHLLKLSTTMWYYNVP